jgi:hypothetical protein
MKSSWVTSLVIGLTVATVLAALTLVAPNLIESWESKTFDLRAQWHREFHAKGYIPFLLRRL